MSEEAKNHILMTCDEIVELYEKDPVSFLETVLSKPVGERGWARRYEFSVRDECGACASWDRIRN